jgi:hypothetical protein
VLAVGEVAERQPQLAVVAEADRDRIAVERHGGACQALGLLGAQHRGGHPELRAADGVAVLDSFQRQLRRPHRRQQPAQAARPGLLGLTVAVRQPAEEPCQDHGHEDGDDEERADSNRRGGVSVSSHRPRSPSRRWAPGADSVVYERLPSPVERGA